MVSESLSMMVPFGPMVMVPMDRRKKNTETVLMDDKLPTFSAHRPNQDSKSEGWSRILESRKLIFALLFLVMAILGVPLLWASPKFSNAERWFWSIVVTIYTAILFAITGAVCWWSWTVIREHL